MLAAITIPNRATGKARGKKIASIARRDETCHRSKRLPLPSRLFLCDITDHRLMISERPFSVLAYSKNAYSQSIRVRPPLVWLKRQRIIHYT